MKTIESNNSVHNPNTRTLRGDLERFVAVHPRLTKALAGGAIALAALGISEEIYAVNATPKFSPETHSYEVQSNDGWESVVENAKIENVNQVGWRQVADHIEHLPANQYILENHQLDPGENVIVPDSVEQ